MLGELLQAKRGEIYQMERFPPRIILGYHHYSRMHVHSEHTNNLYPQGKTYHISMR